MTRSWDGSGERFPRHGGAASRSIDFARTRVLNGIVYFSSGSDTMDAGRTIGISVVVPMLDEAGTAAALVRGIAAACDGPMPYEIIVVDDGSTDGTGKVLTRLRAEIPALRILRHERPGGQSAAVHSGVRAARGGIVCTLDGDGQNPPEELPRLWGPLAADETGRLGLVAGQRRERRDTASRRAASRVANWLRARLLRDGTRDSGCGLKAFRRDAFLALPYFDHMHRYLPALFRRDGWSVALVDVAHRERSAGRSKYSNIQRALVGISDLAGVAWLIRRRKRVEAREMKIGTGEKADAARDSSVV